MGCNPLISGALLNMERVTFAQTRNCYEATREQWIRKLDDMQAIGFDTLFIFEGVHEALRRKSMAAPDLLEFIFAECDRRRMEVIISASGWGDWQVGGVDIVREVNLVRHTAGEIVTRYGGHPSLAGWYLPYECNVLSGSLGDLLSELYRATADACRQIAPRLPVAISPFFVPDTTGRCMRFQYREPAEYVDFWSGALAHARIDILALQDNGGQHLSCFTAADTRPFISAFAEACANAGTRFWGNVEMGELPADDADEFARRYGACADVNDPALREHWRAVPIARLIRKLELMSRFSSRNVSWGYCEFYDPAEGELPRAAYEAYRKYYRRVCKGSRDVPSAHVDAGEGNASVSPACCGTDGADPRR